MVTRLGDRSRVGGTAALAGYDERLRPARRATLAHVVSDLFPNGDDVAKASFWCGLRPMTPDGPPTVGLTEVNGVLLATRHGTPGWTMAAGTGREVTDLVAGKRLAIEAAGLGLARSRSASMIDCWRRDEVQRRALPPQRDRRRASRRRRLDALEPDRAVENPYNLTRGDLCAGGRSLANQGFRALGTEAANDPVNNTNSWCANGEVTNDKAKVGKWVGLWFRSGVCGVERPSGTFRHVQRGGGEWHLVRNHGWQ